MKLIHIFSSFLLGATIHAGVAQYAINAAKKPIAFSLVREDPALDCELIKCFYPDEKVSVLMVASGGCTAAYLIARAPLKNITLVDPNRAQLDLTKLKIHLLSFPPQKRLEILGHLPMKATTRKDIMQGLMLALDIDLNSFGNLSQVAQSGLDTDGRYEKVFEELRNVLAPYKKDIEKLFSLSSINKQVAHIAPSTDFGKALDNALDTVMSQENLVSIFGEKATANRVQDFSRHFAERIRWYLNNNLASQSPWLAHMLLGKFYNNCLFPWLTISSCQPTPNIHYHHGFMDSALSKSASEQYDVIHLSNIIDWLSPEEAEKTLSLAYRALKPGGSVIIRQLNSNVDICHLGRQFEWDLNSSKEFLDKDRSFFYRNIFIGFKPREPQAPRVTACADETLKKLPIIKGQFFKYLPSMDKTIFQKVQTQFFFAVDYFSRPMAALIARMPLHKDRIDILHNIVEEHGNFSEEQYHSNTFKKFLESIGIKSHTLQDILPSSGVENFNKALMHVCTHEDPIIAIACNGIIEYAFADISTLIAQHVVERKWIKKESLVHYNLHANIDKKHAEDFFKLIESAMDDPEQKDKVIFGLQMGASLFNQLYEDLYYCAKENSIFKN